MTDSTGTDTLTTKEPGAQPLSTQEGTSSPRRPMRAWPVLLLALPAFVAIWSGWVGLGELTGFGPVRPLPGIADNFTINTAITLPIGMETYASYALYVWLGNRIRSAGTRRYAKFSAFGSLSLGAVGQVAYHLMQSAGVRSAPWAVTVLVACLPVAVLGMGAALAHMILREHHDPATAGAAEHAVVHGGAQPLPEAPEKSSTATGHGAVAPPHAPDTQGDAPGGACESPDAPASKTGVVRTHRRVPPVRRPARHRSTVRTLRPRSTRTETGVVPAHHPSASVTEAVEPAVEPATPADRDALIRELTARGMSARQIGPLVGVAHTTVLRVLGRTENAPADAPPAQCAPAGTASAPAPVHTTPVRHPGLQVIHAPAGGPVEVIEAELVDAPEPASSHDQSSGTVRRHA